MTPERKVLYDSVTKALEALIQDIREKRVSDAESFEEKEDADNLFKDTKILAHWACVINCVGINEDDDPVNTLYTVEAPSVDAVTAMGLYSAGYLYQQRQM